MDEGLKNLVTKAEQGDVDAMVMVGDCYNRGLHTEKMNKRHTDTIKWLRTKDMYRLI